MTLLFVPGFMADRHLWDDVVTALGPTEAACFADLTEGDSIEDMARRVLAAAPPQTDVVAFSMGGYVARAMARLAPERVRSLVLVATSARADTPTQARQKAAAVAQLSTVASFHGLSRSAIVASLHPDRADDEVLIERVRAMGVRLGKEAFLRQSSLERVSDVEALAQIQCPTLVIAARDDRLRSLEQAQELKDHIPSAQLVVLEHSGHMLPMEAPEEVAQAILAWHRGRH